MRLLGYTRVSTSSQDAQLQLDALLAAGVQKRDVFAVVTSGSKTAIERRGMRKLRATRDDLHLAIVTWIERTDHRRRRQRVLGKLTPVEFEAIMTTQAASAT